MRRQVTTFGYRLGVCCATSAIGYAGGDMRIGWIVTLVLGTSVACVRAADAPDTSAPKKNLGLWEISLTRNDGQANQLKYKWCTDQNTEGLAGKLQGDLSKEASKNCSKNNTRTEGSKVIGDSVCTIGHTQTTTHVVTDSTSLKIEIHTHYTDAQKPDAVTILDGTWLGACTADMQPGDMVLSNGMKINLNTAAAPK